VPEPGEAHVKRARARAVTAIVPGRKPRLAAAG